MEKVSRIFEIRVTEAKDRIKRNYMKGDRTSVLLLGAPGIGKTECIKQLANEIANELGKEYIELKLSWNANGEIDYRNIYNTAVEILKNPEKYFVLIILRLSEREPTDFVGYPRAIELEYNGNKIRLSDYNPFIWQLVASACAGFLVLDDFTNIARPDTESVSYQITLDRISGWVEFNKDLLVIALGNRPEHSSIAKMIATPLISRFRVYNVKPPTVREWINYMNENYEVWDRRIGAFLNKHTDLFIKIPEDPETLDPYPCPRSWTALAKISYDLNEEELYIESAATVGLEAAAYLKNFVSIKVPSVEELAHKPETWDSLNFDQRILATSHIASYITENIDNEVKIVMLGKLFKYLSEVSRDELTFILFILSDNVREKLLEMAVYKYKELNVLEELLLNIITRGE